MEKELPKSYNSDTELEIYSLWEESGLTDPDKMGEHITKEGYEVQEPFTITLPPPNANGNLHLGHVCGYSFHDVIGRYMRMTGHPTLLLPGKDHAGIQTESVFTKILEEKGIDKKEMGREKFYDESYKFCMDNVENAREQEKRIGLSADYSREFFTLDPRLTKIVYETFYKMFEDGLVYRDKRIINQCPNCNTALADVDTEHEERRGIFAYIKYPLVEKQDMEKIKNIYFDVNGVLGNVHNKRDKKLMALLGVESGEMKFLWNLIKEAHAGTKGVFDQDKFWEEIRNHYNISPEVLDKVKEVLIKGFQLNTDMVDFMLELKSEGYKVGILTNGNNDWVKEYFKDVLDPEKDLDFFVCSGSEDCKGKPHEEIFVRATERYSLLPEETLLIDDSSSCIEAVQKLGWKGFIFDGNLDFLREYLQEGVGYITVATTRPETMLGDTAVAVNPNDDRYKDLIGKKVILPIANREIPVIADEDIDMELGTGALKVTPAHSPIDFELGKKHNLDIVNVINESGLMEGDIPERFLGMTTTDCSKALCKELEEEGLLVKIENIIHEVTICERCRTLIEPIISNQWYVNVKPLAEKVLEEMEKGNVKVIPSGQQKALVHFYENIEPWCISRQLWWGQRIPVWYSGGKKLYDWLQENKGKNVSDYEKETGIVPNGSGKIYLGEEKPDSVDGEVWEQETDVFDTWFSSGQWPFSTLGGIEGEDFKKYYPTQMMVHAIDILYWWSARMLMMGLYRTGQVPFNTVFLTGMILAPDGSKMSKSKGNGVEPKEIFDKYGADSLRLWYYSDALPGSNSPLREEKIKGNRNFVNKVWNASRFIIMNIDESEVESIYGRNVEESERIIKTREHIAKVGKYIERNQFNLGAEAIREFFWHQLCDVWIEEIKQEVQKEDIGSDERIALLSELLHILKENLKIMHPFMPFVTESVWQELVKLGLADGLLMSQQMMSL